MNEKTLKRMIRDHKEHAIWVAVVLVLAVFVTALTFGTLRKSVQAQTYTKREFQCPYAQEGAEPVAHTHNDDCYENGELICTLPEREGHIHTDDCYAEEKVLTCGLDESEGHVHDESCYTEEVVNVCGLDESEAHWHDEGCYTRVQGDLICTDEDPEHEHTDDCYAWEEVLTCEKPEGEGHTHTDECFETQTVLSCGKEDGEGAHTHDDSCYEIKKVPTCGQEELQEHVHSADCFKIVDMSPEEIEAQRRSELPESDPYADVESPEDWESRFSSVTLSGEWDKDLLKIAETQLGYTESQRNFDAVLDEEGEGYTLKGYTRYGDWYGIPYGDWCAMFISFCLNYADIPEAAFPYDCATTTWIESLSERDMYAPASEYDPKPGDLIFFDWEGDGKADHVGIVWANNPDSITTIEGNHTASVELFDYDKGDSHIQGYGILPEKPAEEVTSDEDAAADEEATAAEGETSASTSEAEAKKEAVLSQMDPETLAKMPPFNYTERLDDLRMRVTIEADAGAFPEGTTVEIKPAKEDFSEEISRAVSGEVVKIQAVEITFKDAEGNEIEPLIPIRVTMRPFDDAEEGNAVGVIHVSDDGTVSAVMPDESIAQPDKGAAFDADSFSQYILVEYKQNQENKSFSMKIQSPYEYKLADLLKSLHYCDVPIDEGVVAESGEDLTPTLEHVGEEQNSVLTLRKNDNNEWVLSSESEFNDSYILHVHYWSDWRTIDLTGTSLQSMTTTIKFFGIDGEQPEAPTELTKTYYLLGILKDKDNQNELGWAIESIPLSELNNKLSTQVSFDQFHSFDTNDTDVIQYSPINHVIATKLYHADESINPLDYESLTSYATEGMEDGYEIADNSYPDENQNEIDIKKITPKTYKVRIKFDKNAKDAFPAGENYYVCIRVTHANGGVSSQYQKLDIKPHEVQNGSIDCVFPTWLKEDGGTKDPSDVNQSFTGDETAIEVLIVKHKGTNDFKPNDLLNESVSTQGSLLKSYIVDYDTKTERAKTDPSAEYYIEQNTDTEGVYCIDYVRLNTIVAERDYTYESILGPNLLYGIVAEHLNHTADLQTTFAVNHYTGNGISDSPDLSGNSAGSIVIAQFNNYDETKPNGTGTVVDESYTSEGEVNPAGRFIVGNDLKGLLAVYADNASGIRTDKDEDGNPITIRKVTGNMSQTAFFEQNGSELSSSIVEPAIQYGINMSNTLKNKPVTFDPLLPATGNQMTLDTTGLGEFATIYIDADRIKYYIEGELTIKKKDNQTIVFNFTDDYDNLTLNQIIVNQPKIPQNVYINNGQGFPTESPQGKNDVKNTYVDDIARHIVWNLNGVTGKTTINNSAGIVLQPNEAEIYIAGTSAGWIVSNGLVDNGGEWHHVYSDMPNSDTVKLRALKTVNNDQPSPTQKFVFYLEEYNNSKNTWSDKIQQKENNTGSIEFNPINFTSDDMGWHFYRIREHHVAAGPGESSSYLMDPAYYYAAVYVHVIDTHVVAVPPMYYSELNPGDFGTSTEYPTTKRVTLPTFRNTILTDEGSVKVTKHFSGIDSTLIPDDSFQIVAEWKLDPTKPEKETRMLKISGMENNTDVIMDPPGDNGTTYTWTIINLPTGTGVSFTESGYDVEGYSVEVTSSIAAGDNPAIATATAAVDPGIAEFTNKYSQTAQLNITIKKIDDDGIAIGDAIFELWRDDNNKYTQSDYAWIGENGEFTVTSAGFDMLDLKDGTYRLKEVHSPDGYVILDNIPVLFTVYRGAIVQDDSFICKEGVEYVPATIDTNQAFKITNHAGAELPETGGAGTEMFSLIGGVLMLTAGAALLLKKKKSKA